MYMEKKVYKCTWKRKYTNVHGKESLQMYMEKKVYKCTWKRKSTNVHGKKSIQMYTSYKLFITGGLSFSYQLKKISDIKTVLIY